MKFCKALGVFAYICAGAVTTILTGGLAAPAWIVPVLSGAATTATVVSTHLGCQGSINLSAIPSAVKKP